MSKTAGDTTEQVEEKNSLPFKFDKIGYWSELKLEIVEKYGSAYTKAFKNMPYIRKFYIDGFSGAGVHISKETGETIAGSPARAINIDPPFDGYYFIDMDKDKAGYLQSQHGSNPKVHIHNGDSNEYLTRDLLPTIKYEDYKRALCLLDPYGLHLNWDVMEMAGKTGAVEIFLNFPVMDMNRNAIWRNTEQKQPRPEDIERMNSFWGDESWKEAAYAVVPDLFGGTVDKQSNDTIVKAFVERLKKKAGFTYVAEPLPMKNKNNAVVYYLIFAGHKDVAKKIINDIFQKYRGQ